MEEMTYQELQSLWGMLMGERRAISASGGSTFNISAEIKQVQDLMLEKLNQPA